MHVPANVKFITSVLELTRHFLMKFKMIHIFDLVVLKSVTFIPTAVRNFPLYKRSCLKLYDT